MADTALAPEKIRGGVHGARVHDSAAKHVAGSAVYIDDIPEPPGMLHVHIAMSTRPHAKISGIDLDAVRAAPGVVCVLTAQDVPGINDVSPVKGDDPMFADGLVEYAGQSIFAVAATTIDEARAAADLAKIDYEDLAPLISVDDAMEAASFVLPDYRMALGDSGAALSSADKRLSGRFRVGGQDHFYLEGMIALAVPGEDSDVHVYSSTQHPSEVQHNVAKVLGVPEHAVTIELRRMGGGFGGKESQPSLMAGVAALVARKTGRAAKVRLDRDDDMIMTGKRHDFRIDYEVGFRRRRPHRGHRVCAGGALRHVGGPLICDLRPGHVPRRQLLLPRERHHYVAPLQDPYGLEHRVPRFWRTAGHDRHGTGDRRDRLRARQGPAGGPQTELLRRRGT